MNKAQFINKLSQNTHLTKSDVEALLNAAIKLIETSVSKGEEIKIVGFGIFDRLTKKSRAGRHPRTGESLIIPEVKVPRFRPGKEFKDLVSHKKQKSQKGSSF